MNDDFWLTAALVVVGVGIFALFVGFSAWLLDGWIDKGVILFLAAFGLGLIFTTLGALYVIIAFVALAAFAAALMN